MKQLFDDVSADCSSLITRAYSTSFSLGINCLDKRLRKPVCSIYGFVRFADEIVDSFHGYDKAELLNEFREETWKAIDRKISLNPILNSFQHVVNQYHIEKELISLFFKSMETDLQQTMHSPDSYSSYILGSAEVVGLMCLRVFTENNEAKYQSLKPAAMKLGAAFQKVNFLRDIKADHEQLGRVYFPGVNFHTFSETEKKQIEDEIAADLAESYNGIKLLPKGARFGVYMAYVYYKTLFNKIKSMHPSNILVERVRISNQKKIGLLVTSYFRHSLSII